MFPPGCMFEGKNILNSLVLFFTPKTSFLVKMRKNCKPAIYNTGFVRELSSKVNRVEIEEHM